MVKAPHVVQLWVTHSLTGCHYQMFPHQSGVLSLIEPPFTDEEQSL